MSDIQEVQIQIDVTVRDVTEYKQATIDSKTVIVNIPVEIAFDGGTNIGYMIERLVQAIIRNQLMSVQPTAAGDMPRVLTGE